MIDDTDKWVIRCGNFYDALMFANSKKWTVREWSWAPAHTTKNAIQVFRRWRVEDQ